MFLFEKHLPIDLDNFGFVQREVVNGKKLLNQCGRDFLYYVLHYYYPQKFNPQILNPEEIRKKGIFGLPLTHVWLIWTGLSFKKIPKLFRSLNLNLFINGKKIKNFFGFFYATLPLNPLSFNKGIKKIEDSVDGGSACGIDIAYKFFGLIDHVMFVYGYDEENLYVFDTNIVPGLGYEKITPPEDKRFIMKLPKTIIKKRWTIFNRVWVVEKIK